MPPTPRPSKTPAPPPPHVLESVLEAYFYRRVRSALHGMAFKLAPTRAGLPDRLVALPGGLLRLVELKALGGAASAVQLNLHEQLDRLGTTVAVLTGKEDVDAWVDEQRALIGNVDPEDWVAPRRAPRDWERILADNPHPAIALGVTR